MKTRQQVFNEVCNHLLRQKRRASFIDEFGHEVCRYLTVDSAGVVLSCAIGCLIRSEEYQPSLEKETVFNVALINVLRASGVDAEDIDQNHDLVVLQSIHDNVPPERWEAHLRAAAKDLGLRIVQDRLTKQAG